MGSNPTAPTKMKQSIDISTIVAEGATIEKYQEENEETMSAMAELGMLPLVVDPASVAVVKITSSGNEYFFFQGQTIPIPAVPSEDLWISNLIKISNQQTTAKFWFDGTSLYRTNGSKVIASEDQLKDLTRDLLEYESSFYSYGSAGLSGTSGISGMSGITINNQHSTSHWVPVIV